MSPRINIFAVHYFLWFGALTSIYGYISVYAKHYANISASQYGLLNMVLPFATIVAKLFFCSLADLYQAHRTIFVAFLIASLVGYGSFGILPFIIEAQPDSEGPSNSTWLAICVMTSVATLSMSVVSSLTDAFAMNSSRKNRISFGRVRVWGTFGWAASALILSYINQITWLPFLVPGIFMTILLIFVDIVASSLWPNQEDFELNMSNCDSTGISTVLSETTNIKSRPAGQLEVTEVDHVYGSVESQKSTISTNPPVSNGNLVESVDLQTQWFLFKEVARQRKSIFRYLILFTISGILISLQWSYFFLFLQTIFNEEFTYISGLSMLAQALAGELPFFTLSDVIVKTLGRSHTLSISIISVGLRYLLYEFVLRNSSMYFVLLTESFQGPNFSLFYVVMTEVGLDYSDCDEAVSRYIMRNQANNNPGREEKLRRALRATMQSLMGACYEGLGVGIGSILGGIVVEYYGFRALWIWSSVIALVVGSGNILVELLL